jgi:hypothetical protein
MSGAGLAVPFLRLFCLSSGRVIFNVVSKVEIVAVGTHRPGMHRPREVSSEGRIVQKIQRDASAKLSVRD